MKNDDVPDDDVKEGGGLLPPGVVLGDTGVPSLVLPTNL